MVDSDDRIRQLKTSIEQARLAQTRAELERDSANANVVKVRARLKEEFGLEDLAKAREVLARLETDLAKSIDDAYTTLEGAQ